jgi:hypothetical protein
MSPHPRTARLEVTCRVKEFDDTWPVLLDVPVFRELDKRAPRLDIQLEPHYPPPHRLELKLNSSEPLTSLEITIADGAGTLYNHSLAQIAAFLEDAEPIPPGVTDAVAWIPGSTVQPPPAQPGGHILAGVAKKPKAETRAFPPV